MSAELLDVLSEKKMQESKELLISQNVKNLSGIKFGLISKSRIIESKCCASSSPNLR